MVKKRPATKARIGRKDVASIPMRTDAVSVEEETVRRVERTLTAISTFLSRWDSSGFKPADMYPHITRMKRFREELQAWQKEAVRAKSRQDEGARIERLRNFVLICRTYS